ncbi:MAG: ribonuclease H-like domain-containing protein [Nanoarchaeota archaeon]
MKRVKYRTEQSIWSQGITNWDDFLKAKKIRGISDHRKKYYDRQLADAQSALYSFNSRYFLERLPQSETWRIYDFFKDQAVFLDIETTGVGSYDDITLIGLFDGLNTKTMIKSINMDYGSLREELSRYNLIITFNGATFDVPFIKKRYPDVLPNVPNFDLRVACSRIGLKGGLKMIEKRLGIERNKIIEKIYNGDPLLLWKMFKGSGDDYYLNLLVEYNEDDVFNLKKIADYAYSELKKQTLKNGSVRES